MVDRVLMWIVAVCVSALIAAIVVGASNMVSENSEVRSNCVKTTMVVIGNKGHVTPVYDCKDAR